MSSGGVCHYCHQLTCMCGSEEGLVSSPGAAAAAATAEIVVLELVDPRRVAVRMTVGIDSRFDAKTLSDSLAIAFWDDANQRYIAQHPHVQNLRVAGWKLFQLTRQNGEVVRHESGVTAFVLEIEIECVSDLTEETLRGLFGVNFATREGELLGETHSDGNEIVEYSATAITEIEGQLSGGEAR